ncbi:PREDICTED: uncharacterized protein LOC107069757 isoform X1 [Polistes dominula]|uniref:Uncharacterized protein LOC107069757 isoform X1 n=1 Tax=Polistes dominula TaxID=743375 RepID=A0ABM1IRG6_POLDO|nr:PREDICTED: uncharacterized protein LOC107069757 isoform X1 [Polistes dominula]
MKNNIQKLTNFVSKILYGHKTFNNVSAKLESAVANTKDQLANHIKNLNIIQEFKAVPLQSEKPMPHRLVIWWQWYQQLTGLHSVEKARQQVILLQDLLMKCQEKRRTARQEAFMINNRIKEIYSEMLSTKREDPKYVKLTMEENNSLREQSIITEKLILLEEEEKDNFLYLTTTIKEYHDAQTMYSHKHKYVTILATITSAILSIICSLIYQSKRSEDMETILSLLQKNNESNIKKNFDSLKQYFEGKMSNDTSSNQVQEQSQNTWETTKWALYIITAILALKMLNF